MFCNILLIILLDTGLVKAIRIKCPQKLCVLPKERQIDTMNRNIFKCNLLHYKNNFKLHCEKINLSFKAIYNH